MSNSNATCYVNDGRIAETDYFCGLPNQDTCCGPGWECLSNGLCQTTGTPPAYAQGTCTDPNYKKCLSFCNYAQTGNFTTVSRCEPAGNSWCFRCALQDPNGPSCCDTNLTTSLEPYPFTIGTPLQSTVDSSSSMTSIPSVTELTVTLSASSYPVTFLEPTSETFIKTSTPTLATSSGALTSSPSTQPSTQSYNSKINMTVAITVAVIVILLAIVAFFIFQNQKFRRRLLQLRDGPSGHEETRTAVHICNENLPGELDLTHYELAQQNTPRHELSGNQIHEAYSRGIPVHDLIRDGYQR